MNWDLVNWDLVISDLVVWDRQSMDRSLAMTLHCLYVNDPHLRLS
ncbi:MAG: hypothetical protein VW709_20355 [Rickettsiales bacterium]